MDDWTDALGTHDAPDEECHPGGWRDDGLEGEKVSTERGFVSVIDVGCALVTRTRSSDVHFVDREPDRRKGDKPKKEETDKVSRRSAR